MATAELGDWHTGRIAITQDNAELIIFEQTSDEGGGQMCLVGLEAILALRDMIDEEVQSAEQRSEIAARPPESNGG